MARLLVAALSGAVFGLGLLVSGMTDTRKVQGWLDLFGDWDPTLAFVMGGAILPMALAWAVVARRRAAGERALTGAPLPGPARRDIDRNLVAGSVIFGAGWALAGLCPGPALASLGFGGRNGLAFLAAMLAGMLAARWLGLSPRESGPAPAPPRDRPAASASA